MEQRNLDLESSRLLQNAFSDENYNTRRSLKSSNYTNIYRFKPQELLKRLLDESLKEDIHQFVSGNLGTKAGGRCRTGKECVFLGLEVAVDSSPLLAESSSIASDESDQAMSRLCKEVFSKIDQAIYCLP